MKHQVLNEKQMKSLVESEKRAYFSPEGFVLKEFVGDATYIDTQCKTFDEAVTQGQAIFDRNGRPLIYAFAHDDNGNYGSCHIPHKFIKSVK